MIRTFELEHADQIEKLESKLYKLHNEWFCGEYWDNEWEQWLLNECKKEAIEIIKLIVGVEQ